MLRKSEGNLKLHLVARSICDESPSYVRYKVEFQKSKNTIGFGRSNGVSSKIGQQETTTTMRINHRTLFLQFLQ